MIHSPGIRALVLGVALLAPAGPVAGTEPEEGHSSRLTAERIPLQLEAVPERPSFLIEWGNPYLGTGRIHRGFKLPTGAIWQPSFIVFGNFRTALQSFDDGAVRVTEWANRLDLFFNLQLSGTERLVVGFRPLDLEGDFTSYIFEPDPGDPAFQERYPDGDRFRNELNGELQTLFFEGDFGEIFGSPETRDFRRTDVGFAIGRQPMIFQDGILIADSMDGLGLTRNTLQPKNTSNLRLTFFFALNEIHRSNVLDKEAELYALLTSTDIRSSTIDADVAWVDGSEMTGDLLSGGVSSVQRIGRFNTTFRFLGSYATGEETALSTDGGLFFSEVSLTPHHNHDLFYFNTFWAVDTFSSAARGPEAGGPLGRAGINFAAVGLGNFGAPLSSEASNVAGGAVGYQKFLGALNRKQLIFELGMRLGTDAAVPDSAATTIRYQMALGRRFVVVCDGFVGYREDLLGEGAEETRYGTRLELQIKF